VALRGAGNGKGGAMRSLPEILRDAAELMEKWEEVLAEERRPIMIWPFDDAPSSLRALSENGGDEDWVAFVPQWLWEKKGGWIPFLEPGTSFGVCNVEEHPVPGGVVLIGCHA